MGSSPNNIARLHAKMYPSCSPAAPLLLNPLDPEFTYSVIASSTESDHGSLIDAQMMEREVEQYRDFTCCGLPLTDLLVELLGMHHVVDLNHPHDQLLIQPTFPPPESSYTTPNEKGIPTRSTDSSPSDVLDPSEYDPGFTSWVIATDGASESDPDVAYAEPVASALPTQFASSSSNSNYASTRLSPSGDVGGSTPVDGNGPGTNEIRSSVSDSLGTPILTTPITPFVNTSSGTTVTTFPWTVQANYMFATVMSRAENHSIQDQVQNQPQGKGQTRSTDPSAFFLRQHGNGGMFSHPYARAASSSRRLYRHPLSLFSSTSATTSPLYGAPANSNACRGISSRHLQYALRPHTAAEREAGDAQAEIFPRTDYYSRWFSDPWGVSRSHVGITGGIDGQAVGPAEGTIRPSLMLGASVSDNAGDMNEKTNRQVKTKPMTSAIISARETPEGPETDWEGLLHNLPEPPATSPSPLLSSKSFKCPAPDCINYFTTVDKFLYHVMHGACLYTLHLEIYSGNRNMNRSVCHHQYSFGYGFVGKEGGTGQTNSMPMASAFPDNLAIGELVQAEEGVVQNLVDIVQLAIMRNDTRDTCMLDRFLTLTAEKRRILPSSVFLNGVRRIGSNCVHGGGFADVWMGEYEGRSVALKVLRIFGSQEREKMQLDFSKEALLWRKLDHPNILPFLGICRDSFAPRMALVSHWMEKGSLESFLKQNPQADCLKLAIGVARGLEYLHGLKPRIIHGDLRGANVLIDEDNKPRITDFGLSKAINSQDTLTASSFKGKGTLRWQAPELLDSSRFGEETSILTTKSDAYAFSCLCLEIFTGKVPFAGHYDGYVIMEVAVHDRRPPKPGQAAVLKGFNDEIWSVMQLCWKTQPHDRPEMSFVVSSLKKSDCPGPRNFS